jgi:hypothetical protein
LLFGPFAADFLKQVAEFQNVAPQPSSKLHGQLAPYLRFSYGTGDPKQLGEILAASEGPKGVVLLGERDWIKRATEQVYSRVGSESQWDAWIPYWINVRGTDNSGEFRKRLCELREWLTHERLFLFISVEELVEHQREWVLKAIEEFLCDNPQDRCVVLGFVSEDFDKLDRLLQPCNLLPWTLAEVEESLQSLGLNDEQLRGMKDSLALVALQDERALSAPLVEAVITVASGLERVPAAEQVLMQALDRLGLPAALGGASKEPHTHVISPGISPFSQRELRECPVLRPGGTNGTFVFLSDNLQYWIAVHSRTVGCCEAARRDGWRTPTPASQWVYDRFMKYSVLVCVVCAGQTAKWIAETAPLPEWLSWLAGWETIFLLSLLLLLVLTTGPVVCVLFVLRAVREKLFDGPRWVLLYVDPEGMLCLLSGGAWGKSDRWRSTGWGFVHEDINPSIPETDVARTVRVAGAEVGWQTPDNQISLFFGCGTIDLADSDKSPTRSRRLWWRFLALRSLLERTFQGLDEHSMRPLGTLADGQMLVSLTELAEMLPGITDEVPRLSLPMEQIAQIHRLCWWPRAQAYAVLLTNGRVFVCPHREVPRI